MTTPTPSPADTLQQLYNDVVAAMSLVHQLQADPTTPEHEFMEALAAYLTATWNYHWHLYDTPNREGNTAR